MKTFNSGKHATQNYELQPVLLFFFFFFLLYFFNYFILLQIKHTQKEKLHRINKEIKRKKQKTKKPKENLHTYMAIYLQILKYVTAVLIAYITVLL